MIERSCVGLVYSKIAGGKSSQRLLMFSEVALKLGIVEWSSELSIGNKGVKVDGCKSLKRLGEPVNFASEWDRLHIGVKP